MGQEPEQTPAPEQAEAAESQTPESTSEPKVFDEAYVRKLRAENADWRNKAKQASEEAEELKERDKSEGEKLVGKLTKAEQRAVDAESKLIRYEVATEKQIPADAMDLLVGATREELVAKADKILEFVANKPDAPAPDFDGGPREPSPDPKTPDEAHNESILGLLGRVANT